jgi:spoIIIJ-associated protein
MSELRSIEATGPDVNTAIARGLAQLNLPRKAVIVDVINEGSRGILGIGAKQARVRILVREPEDLQIIEAEAPPAPDEAVREAPAITYREDDDAQAGTAALEELLEKMHVNAKVNTYRAEPSTPADNPPWVLEIRGRDLGVLIGRRGETLAALQYLTRLIASRDLQRRTNVIVDVEGYKTRRAKQLRRLSARMADQAVQRGRTIALEPMAPYERRIVHLALRDRPDVTTESVGEGDRRKVTIIPSRD